MSNIRSQLNQADVHEALAINEDIDIQDMGEYVVCDNVFADPDSALKFLIGFPADTADELKRLMYLNNDTKPEFKTPNGITQLLPNQYFDVWFQELYKILIEAEFIPHQVNEYLKDKAYMSGLSRNGLVVANLQHDNMTIHKRANWPAPVVDFDYSCNVFLGDDIDPENGISFYDLMFKGERYKNIDDFAKIEDKELQATLRDYLNIFVTVQPDLEPYKPYEETKYYDKVRFVEAQKNRMVIFKSGKWMIHDYNGKEDSERYLFNTNIIVQQEQQGGPPGGPEGQQPMIGQQQLPDSDNNPEPQQWDSDY